jgi:hypothetical protein
METMMGEPISNPKSYYLTKVDDRRERTEERLPSYKAEATPQQSLFPVFAAR